jgi:hypothetical protein
MMPIQLINVVLIGLVGGLTPYERFQAIRQLDAGSNNSLFTNKWFMLLGWSLIFLLVMVLIVVHRMRMEKEKRQLERRYDELADRMNLTAQEREIMDAIAIRTGSSRKDMVFRDPDVFENGLARLMQDVFADGHNLVYRKKLQAAVYAIQEKLGHIKPAPAGQPRSGKELSSRHIPVGQITYLSLAGRDDIKRIPAEVIANDAYEFVVRTDIPLICNSGEKWMVEYEAGTVTWEFEAITLACSAKTLELNHSDRIRFVNRRRFPRVAVRKKALIARLPLFRNGREADDLQPIFFDAEINEISGPGLRIHTELEPLIHERVLVIFEMEPGRVVQDIGQVRDFRKTPLGRAVIVELVGLNDRAVDEMVRVTNQLVGQARCQSLPQNSNCLAEVS